MTPNERTETQSRKNLQKYLRQLSYHDPEIPAVPIDGVNSEETTAAIRAFQQKYGLPVTGSADRETWDALYEAYLRSLLLSGAPLGIYPIPTVPEDYALKEGDRGWLVLTVQHLLGALSLLFPAFTELSEDGSYGSRTAGAVREFQNRTLLEPTGQVDRMTWNEIVRLAGSLGLYT